MFEILSGDPARLGATPHEGGYNFALFSEHATQVDVCLYSADGKTAVASLTLPDCHSGIWSGFIPKLTAPFAYGYRVHGPWSPDRGHRFNASKLLVDPYARQLVGEFDWSGHVSGHGPTQHGHAAPCPIDSAPYVPKALVQAGNPVYARPCHGRADWPQTLIWEAHVRGTTLRHPEVPETDRGCFRGMASDAMLDYLKTLGITAVELMPVQSMLSERHLVEHGLSNYWGYNPLSFFAFNRQFYRVDPLAEFGWMIDRFHAAGIEVILDVVYNHSCESDASGPTLCYRGIDNKSYYRLDANDPSIYVNDTGCGNTFNVDHPIVQRLVLDNLRWLASLGVDGFRFDLGVVLGRTEHGFHRDAPLWQAIVTDPVLKTRRLITEPWDIGPDGYQLGRMPALTAEWNDRFRDTVRRAWRGDAGVLPELARRLHGSADVFETHGRPPHCSVNYLASHDGASLADLVQFVGKHNLANGEHNRDGHHDNIAQNFGVEGPSADPELLALRGRNLRSLMATLLISQGTPMITAGDEYGHSRQGNNNAYCQDNAINWLDWSESATDVYGLRSVVQLLSALRRRFPLLFEDRWRHQHDDAVCDGIDWFHPAGRQMELADWENPNLRQLMMRVVANGGEQDLLVALNTSDSYCDFVLPPPGGWQCVLDTANPTAQSLQPTELSRGELVATGSDRLLLARSVQVFIAERSVCSAQDLVEV